MIMSKLWMTQEGAAYRDRYRSCCTCWIILLPQQHLIGFQIGFFEHLLYQDLSSKVQNPCQLLYFIYHKLHNLWRSSDNSTLTFIVKGLEFEFPHLQSKKKKQIQFFVIVLTIVSMIEDVSTLYTVKLSFEN